MSDSKRAVAIAKQPPPENAENAMREALRRIDEDLSWFFECAGAVSREDMVGMIRDAQKRIESVRGDVWPSTETQDANAPIGGGV